MTKDKGGRPSKFTPEIREKILGPRREGMSARKIAIKLVIDTKKWCLFKKRPKEYGVKADAPEPDKIKNEFVPTVKAQTMEEFMQYQAAVQKQLVEKG